MSDYQCRVGHDLGVNTTIDLTNADFTFAGDDDGSESYNDAGGGYSTSGFDWYHLR